MRSLRFREALREAMIEEMQADDRVFLMGEEVGHYQGAYKVSEGMLEKFGPKRVIDTPIAEGGFAGVGVGAAMVGLRPIIEFMTWNFSAVAFDQILNNAAKLRQMSGGQFNCPIVFRGPNASARQVGSQHSHAMEHFYATVPGLKVVAPAFPADAKGLLKAAIRDDNPVLVMESETLYSVKGDVPDDLDAVPLGEAKVARPGKDVTLVAYSRMTHVALEAATALAKEGIEAEVIDLRSLRPLDEGTIVASVEKTHHCVVVHEGWPYGGVGAEVADRVQRLAFDALDAPVLRVTTLDVPMPYNAKLELACIPQVDRVVATAKRVVTRAPTQRSRLMAKILEMPKLSPTMEEGVLSTLHKKEGDEVQVDDLLAEVETDKATMEFRAFDKGTLLKLLVTAGANVKLGQPVAILGSAGEDVSELVAKAGGPASTAAPAPAAAPPPAAGTAPAPAASAAPAPAASPAPETLPPPAQRNLRAAGGSLDRTSREPEHDGAGAARGADAGRPMASPYVRKVAREMGIDLAGAQGTGPGGRIVATDLEGMRTSAMQRATPAAQPGGTRAPGPLTLPTGGRAEAPRLAEPEVRPLSPMRKTIARRLTEAKQTVPHFYLTIDVLADELVQLRERINAELASSGPNHDSDKPLKVSLNDLLVKACAVALTRVPECNAQYTSDAILVHRRVDISVAVAIPEGLVTPVVRNADQKSVVAIAQEVRDLAARARAKKLKPEEMQDGTFSISNLGMFGIDEFAAVINPPEGAILAVGRVRDEPVVKDGAVAPGKKLAMTLSCDHRVVDGAVGAAFLSELRGLIERPLRVLTG